VSYLAERAAEMLATQPHAKIISVSLRPWDSYREYFKKYARNAFLAPKNIHGI
jgi:hypothetical protein